MNYEDNIFQANDADIVTGSLPMVRDFYRFGIQSLFNRWRKCIDIQGDHVENIVVL